MNKLIICDLDGTLIDSRKDLAVAVNKMRQSYGLETLSVDVIASYVGDGVTKLVERSLADTDIDITEAVERKKAFYRECLVDYTHTYEGVDQGLKTLKEAGYSLAVASNKPVEFCQEILTKLGIAELFCCILGDGSVANRKPAPDMIIKAMEIAGCSAENSWMIGDHHTDLLAAGQANVKAVFAAYGIGHTDGVACSFSCNNFADFTERLLNA